MVLGVIAGAVAVLGTKVETLASPGHHHRSAATFEGPDGVEASWVLAENAKRGTTAWEIPHGVVPGAIEGFADENYVATGARVTLYVSTRAPSYRVEAFRMGYYGGTGARLVWTSRRLRARRQPACTLTTGINMVSCANWHASMRLRISRAFVQGDYLLKLVADSRIQGYVLLTVWDPSSRATYLLMNRSFVEQGWNTFGGFSYYQGEGACAPDEPVYPVCNRARVVSFDRPYDTGDGASDFLGDEYPLIRFCEEHGLDVAYVTDVTVTEHPSIVARHKVLLSLGHDESWSYQERVGVDEAEARGMNIVFFGAASILRHVRLQASRLGPDREEVDYRDADEDPLNGHASPMLVTGNTWDAPPTDWTADGLIGEVYSGYLEPGLTAPFKVADASSWVFHGTGLHDGSTLPDVIASDIDHVIPSSITPRNLTVLGHSPIPLSLVYTNQGTWGDDTYSDMTYYTDPRSHAGIIDTGDNNWINAMGTCPRRGRCAAPDLAVITGNILALFGRGPAGDFRPSRSNLATITPAGS